MLENKYEILFAIIRSDGIRNYWHNCQDIEVIQKSTMFDVRVHKIQIRVVEHRLRDIDANAFVFNVTFQCQKQPNKFPKMRGKYLNEIEWEEWNEPSDPSTKHKKNTHTHRRSFGTNKALQCRRYRSVVCWAPFRSSYRSTVRLFVQWIWNQRKSINAN